MERERRIRNGEKEEKKEWREKGEEVMERDRRRKIRERKE